VSTEPHQPVSVNPLGARERARRVYHWVPGAELAADARVAAIATVAAEQDRLRRAWLNPEGADEATLKKRTLTNLYNARPAWLEHAHAALDHAVWTAYGWDDPAPAAVPEDAILARLLALNGERSLGAQS